MGRAKQRKKLLRSSGSRAWRCRSRSTLVSASSVVFGAKFASRPYLRLLQRSSTGLRPPRRADRAAAPGRLAWPFPARLTLLPASIGVISTVQAITQVKNGGTTGDRGSRLPHGSAGPKPTGISRRVCPLERSTAVAMRPLTPLKFVMVTEGRIASASILDRVFSGIHRQGAWDYQACYERD